MPTPNSLDTLIAKLKMLNQLDEGDLSAKEVLSQWIASLKASKFKKTSVGGAQPSLKGPGAGLSEGFGGQDLSLLSIANEWLKNIAENVEKIAYRIGVSAPATTTRVAETLAAVKTPTRQASPTEVRPSAPAAASAAPAASLPLSGVLKLVLLMKPLKKLAGLGVETEKGLGSLGRGLLAVGKPIAMIGGVIGNFGIKNAVVLRMLLGSLLKLSQSSQGVEEGFISFGKALQAIAKPIMMIGSVIANFGIKNALVLRVLLGSLSKMSGMGKRAMTGMEQFAKALQAIAKPIEEIGSVLANFGIKNALVLRMLLGSLSKMSPMGKRTMTGMVQFGMALQYLSKPIQEIGSVIANFGMKNILALFLLIKGLINIGKTSKGVKAGLVELGEGLGAVGMSVKTIIEPITALFDSIASFFSGLLKGAAAVIVFAGGIYLVGKAMATFGDLDLSTIAKAVFAMIGLAAAAQLLSGGSFEMIKGAFALGLLSAALWVAAEAFQHFGGIKWVDVMKGVVAIAGIAAAASFAAAGLAIGGAALLVFGVGLMATAAALKNLGDSTDSLKKLTELDGANLWSVAKAIGAISIAMASFGAGQVAEGIGSLFSRILTIGQDTPIQQMEKMSKMGPGLVQAADGFSRIPGAIKRFAETDIDAGLKAVGKVAAAASSLPQPSQTLRTPYQSLTPEVTKSSGQGAVTVVSAPMTNAPSTVVNNSSMVLPPTRPRNDMAQYHSYDMTPA